MAGPDELVGVRLDPRRHPQKDVDRPSRALGDLLESGQLREAVGHDPADPRGDRGFELLDRLVVAVEHETLTGISRRDRGGELSSARHVAVQPLRRRDLQHTDDTQRLRGVGDRHVVAERLAVAPHAVHEGRAVHDVERGAELGGEVLDRYAPDGPQPPIGQLGGVGEGILGGHIRSGASTPSSASALASDCRAATTSQ